MCIILLLLIPTVFCFLPSRSFVVLSFPFSRYSSSGNGTEVFFFPGGPPFWDTTVGSSSEIPLAKAAG